MSDTIYKAPEKIIGPQAGTSLSKEEQVQDYLYYLIATLPDSRMPSLGAHIQQAGFGDTDPYKTYTAQIRKIPRAIISGNKLLNTSSMNTPGTEFPVFQVKAERQLDVFTGFSVRVYQQESFIIVNSEAGQVKAVCTSSGEVNRLMLQSFFN